MRSGRRLIVYLLLLVVQVLLWNYLNLSQYVLLCFLPAMILCLPVRLGTVPSMCIAFAIGLVVDFFAQGVLGLSSFALVPVALARRPIISLVYGGELFSRGEDPSVRRQGVFKMSLLLLLGTALFLLLYIWMDGAGTRPLWFNLLRFACSLLLSTALSVFVADQITREEDERWR